MTVQKMCRRKRGSTGLQRGHLFVVSGPSGAGKGTLVAQALKALPHLRKVTTYTTRPPRPGEQKCRDYHFVSSEQFEEMKKRGAFLEWAVVYGHSYGSPIAEVERIRDDGKDVVLVLDVQGASAVKKKFPEAILIFVEPPSPQELERRLRERGTDSPSAIEQRIATAPSEMAQKQIFDFVIVNDQLDQAVHQLIRILKRAQTEAGEVARSSRSGETDPPHRLPRLANRPEDA